ncbi:MAG: hypothetical protein ACTMKV_04165 [Sphingomonas parapaucimobilis]
MSDLIRTTPPKPPARSIASVVARAKSALPAQTGAAAAAAAQRAGRAPLTILADTSGSMSRPAGPVRRIDALRRSLASVLTDVPGAATIAFSSVPRKLAHGASLPEPDGGTAIHLALEAASSDHLLVISDGEPDSADRALAVARRLAGQGVTIDTLFIGDDSDTAAIAFMRDLAQAGRGRSDGLDISRHLGDTQRLTAAIRQLAAPR